jgi:hypothetical protein
MKLTERPLARLRGRRRSPDHAAERAAVWAIAAPMRDRCWDAGGEYAVIGQLGPDGAVELVQIDLDTDGIG